MEQEKKVFYTEEAVSKALELLSLGIIGLLDKEEAEKRLSELPESLQTKVMIMTVAAIKTMTLKEVLRTIKPKSN